MYDQYTLLPTSDMKDKLPFMLDGKRYIFETHPATSGPDFIRMYEGNQGWGKGMELSISPWKTGDCYLPLNNFNDDQGAIPGVITDRLVWCGSKAGGANQGWVGTWNPTTDAWARAIVPVLKNWGWVNFIGYRAYDGYFYMTGFPNGNLIARCTPANLTIIENWQWMALPTFTYASSSYACLNFFQGYIYIYRQAAVDDLSWDIVKGDFEGGWAVIKTVHSSIPHPLDDYCSNMATDGEYLYAPFLEKPGQTYYWRLKKSTDGINWTTVVTETMRDFLPTNLVGVREAMVYVFVTKKNPTQLAMCQVAGMGTMHFYDTDGNSLAEGGAVSGLALGFLRDVQPQSDGYHDHHIGVFGHQYNFQSGDTPYCSHLTRMIVEEVFTREDMVIEFPPCYIQELVKPLQNVSQWGMTIELVRGFDYNVMHGDSVTYQLHVRGDPPPHHDAVPFSLDIGLPWWCQPISPVIDWFHEPFENAFECLEEFQDFRLIVSPEEYYHPPGGNNVNFTLSVQLTVPWNEVNWGWVQNMVNLVGWAGLNLTAYSVILAAGVTIDLGLDAIEELLKEIQVKTAHMVNAAAEATGIGSAELDAFLKVILETDARGIGTSTLENVVVVIAPIKIYAEGTGIGSGSLMSYLVLLQGAEGIGIGSGSLTPYAVIIPHAEGLGISSAEVQSLLRVIAGASGVGIGTGEVPCEWAIGYGIGSGSLNALVIVLASALGEGIGSGQTSTLLAALVDAIGVGIGTGEATQYLDISAMAAGLGIGTGESLGWHVGIILAEALGEGMGLAYVLTLKGRHTVRMSCTEEHRVGMTLALRED